MIDKKTQTPEDLQARDALMRLFMDQLPTLQLFHLSGTVIFAYAVRDTGVFTVLWWLTLNVISIALSLALIGLYKRYVNRLDSFYWALLHTVPATLTGALWGATTFLFMDASDPYSVVLHTILLIGILSGGLYSLSLISPVYYFFSLSALTLYVFAIYDVDGFFEITIASVFLSLAWCWISYRSYAMMKELFIMRARNERLLESVREEKKLAEHASRAKTRFLATASHDLRQPLQAQRLFAESIRHKTQDSELRELGDYMVESQRAMQLILDSLLDISQLDAGVVTPKPMTVCLHDLFSNILHEFTILATEKGLAFHVHWPARDALVFCDPGLVESILRNLLGNAITYTEQGSVMLAVRNRSNGLRIEVRDSGIGIDADQQSSIFEEFRQLENAERNRHKGLGLGLSIVQRLCRLLDYPLSLSSRTGKGSVFAFELPLALNQVEPMPVIQPKLNMEVLLKFQVLVVDDDPIVKEALFRSLRSLGFIVHSAADRVEALNVLQSYTPDVMIVDYRLPDQDTGKLLIERLRLAIGRDVPAILLTGDTAPEQLKDLSDITYPILHKPVSMHQLLTTMQCISTPLLPSVIALAIGGSDSLEQPGDDY